MKAILTFLALFFSLASFAKSNLQIKNAYLKFPPPGSSTTALFLDVINNDDVDHKILKIYGPVISDDFELHEMDMSNGRMTMRKVESVYLKKKSTTSLKSGGLHVMIFNLKRALKVNETVELGIQLDNQEKIQIKAIVQSIN